MVHRILSLDGGGAWALIEATALRDLFGDVPGREILSKFDLAVANSGGSIVLGGLIENMLPSEIIGLFDQQSNRQAIFAKTSLIENLLSHIPIFPKYSTAGKLNGLTRVFGTIGAQPLSSFAGGGWVPGPNGQDVKVLIVAFDYGSSRAKFFRSYGTAHGATADNVPLVQAVHASSDAPIEFFDAPTQWNNRRYWDGAMAGLNNPLLSGLVDLLGEGVAPSEVVALSLGTGTIKLAPAQAVPPAPKALSEPQTKPGVLNDLEKAGGCITDDPPDMATFAAHVMLSAARGQDPTVVGPVVRLSPVVRPILIDGAWVVPPHLDAQQFQKLTETGMDAVEQDQVEVIAALAASWLADGARNQPIRMNSDDLSSSLGEEVYSAAKARWFSPGMGA
ncbi:MAG TPA: patatin-like phospholipase family protein [Caulobacteraceae bacterium]|nr:patatin-like phospholipase family protein [Caulobacteraceae bacterium]